MRIQLRKAYYSSAVIVFLGQILKLFHIIPYVEACSICAVFLTIIFSVRFWLIENKEQQKNKYWLFVVYILVLEAIIGLDRILPEHCYNIAIICALAASSVITFFIDSPSVRKKMDENEYVMKNTSTILSITLLIELARYMFTHLLNNQ